MQCSLLRGLVGLAVITLGGCAASEPPETAGASAAESTGATTARYSLRCQEISEVSIFEDATGWAISFRAPTHSGGAVNMSLAPSIDPAFFAAATGAHVTFRAHIPRVGSDPACRFSPTVSTVFGCSTRTLENPTLSDGVTEKALADHNLIFETDRKTVDSMYGKSETVEFHLRLPDHADLWGGYVGDFSFQAGSCAAVP